MEQRLKQDFALDLPITKWLDEDNHLHEETLRERIIQAATDEYKRKEELAGEQTMRNFEKGVMLQTLDDFGKNIYLRWITYAVVFIYAVMHKKIRNKSTKKSLSKCLPKCWMP